MLKEMSGRIQLSIVKFPDGEGLCISEFFDEGSKDLRIRGEVIPLFMRDCPESTSILIDKDGARSLYDFLSTIGEYKKPALSS